MHAPPGILRRVALGAVLAAVAVPAGALATTAHSAAGATVTLKGIAFHPTTVKIKAGQSVTWVWKDGSVAHNVAGQGFKSPLKTSGSYTHRYAKKGTFPFRCTVHPAMKGKVVVS